MEKLVKCCEFNIDTGCVEVEFLDGRKMSVDCTAVENELADNIYERSELDYIVHNEPMEYVNLILRGEVKNYLNTVTDYTPLS